MNTVIKAIVLLIMAITVIFYGGALLLPGEVRVERSIDIAAPPAKVFAIAGNLRRVPDWSPWVVMDPRTAFTFEGPEQGVGQVMHWASNNPMVGKGTETVTAFVPDQMLVTRTDYDNFGAATGMLTLTPAGSGTKLTRVFVSALPGVFDRWAGLGMDKSVGAEFETGLAKIKALAESP